MPIENERSANAKKWIEKTGVAKGTGLKPERERPKGRFERDASDQILLTARNTDSE